MNIFEAKLILRCQSTKYVRQIWKSIIVWRENRQKHYSYSQIASKCEELYLRGYMIRRRVGKKVFYRSTAKAIIEAVKLLNATGEKRQREAETLRMMMNNKRITNYV